MNRPEEAIEVFAGSSFLNQNCKEYHRQCIKESQSLTTRNCIDHMKFIRIFIFGAVAYFCQQGSWTKPGTNFHHLRLDEYTLEGRRSRLVLPSCFAQQCWKKKLTFLLHSDCPKSTSKEYLIPGTTWLKALTTWNTKTFFLSENIRKTMNKTSIRRKSVNLKIGLP